MNEKWLYFNLILIQSLDRERFWKGEVGEEEEGAFIDSGNSEGKT